MNFRGPDFFIKKGGLSWEITLYGYAGKDTVVRIPAGVEAIDEFTFGNDIEPNTTIQKIIMPDTIKSLDPYALSYCEALKEIEFSPNITALNITLEGCKSLTEIYIPEEIKTIELIKRERSLSKIHVGKNITSICENAFGFLSDIRDEEGEFILQKGFQNDTISVLLNNPAYAIIGGFMVNRVHKTSLFLVDSYFRPEMSIPDCVEVIGENTIDEWTSARNGTDRCIQKLIIPESVKKVSRFAFCHCYSLSEVVYEGDESEIEFDDMSFCHCPFFPNELERELDNADDAINQNSKTSNMKLERLVFIHHCYQQGRYMNKNQLQAELMRHFGLAKLGISTITRDLEFLRDRFDAPIEYDFYHKGYHYTEEFELTL